MLAVESFEHTDTEYLKMNDNASRDDGCVATDSTHQQQSTAYALGPEAAAASISAGNFGVTLAVHLPGPEGTR
jgi:hypothetical protein